MLHFKKGKSERTSRLAVIAMLSGVSFMLFFLKFSLPFVPAFLTLDFSDLPALLAGFALGPTAGVSVVLIKNLLHLFFTSTAGLGELANFLVGASYVYTCAIIYEKNKTKKGAIIAMASGTLAMCFAGVITNYCLLMPLYSLIIPIDSLVLMFSSVNPKANTPLKIVLFTIAPLNVFKGLVLSTLMLFLYKKLSPIIKGTAA